MVVHYHLGGVDKFELVSSYFDEDQGEEALGDLVIAGCNGAGDFQTTE